MTKNELIEALKLLGHKLKSKNLQGEIILTGGASMCLVHDARDMTKDVDALYEPKSVINDLVQEVSNELSLPFDWLNDSVKGFVNENLESDFLVNYDALKISSVTPEYLLAMKLMSSRVEGQDYNDIKFLLNKLNIQKYDDAVSILEKYYPTELILPKTKYVIEECLMKEE